MEAPSFRRSSSAMDISSIVNNTDNVQPDVMDITMVLNPEDVKMEDAQPLRHVEAWETAGSREEFGVTIREPFRYIQQLQPAAVDALQDYQSQLARLETHPVGRLRTRLPNVPLHQRPSTHGLARFNYPSRTSLPHLNEYPYTRQIYSSSPPFSRARHSGSHARPKSVKIPHSNKAYTEEEVDFIRYHKDDLGLKWDPLLIVFKRVFPGRSRESDQCLSSRYYRANKFKLYDENGKVMRDENGKVMYLSAKVRGRGTPEGKEEGLPYTLVQRFPQRGLKYSWVSDEHKRQMRILAAEMDDEARERMYSDKAQKLRKEREERDRASGRDRSSSVSVTDGLELLTRSSPPPFRARL